MKNKSWLLLVVIALGGLILDMATKFAAMHLLQYGRGVPLIGPFVQFMLVYNRGALFGLNPRAFIPGFPVNTFFTIASFAAIALLLCIFSTAGRHDRLLRWGVTLVLPGALGNLSDRILHPEKGVVDFIKIGISEEVYWPIFNFADMYVTFGIALILLSSLRAGPSRDHDRREPAQQ
jgi:signal peptidase II